MQPERADLYFQQGSSDKVYHLQLENVQDQWSVQAQWGRRGSALQSDVKVSGTSYEEAKRVYDRILREKTGKGYQIAQARANGNEAIAVGLPPTKEHSGHTPELLTPIEEPEALLLAQDKRLMVPAEIRRAAARSTKVRVEIFRHQQARPNHSYRLSAGGIARPSEGARFPGGRRNH